VALVLLLILLLAHVHRRIHGTGGQRPHPVHTAPQGQGQQRPVRHNLPNEPSARFRWQSAAGVLVLLLAPGGGDLASPWDRRPTSAGKARTAAEALAEVLDDTLDDLRNEGDPRRAVIAAYARMERTMAAYGLPRIPSEAPEEYLRRMLAGLDVSGASAGR